MQYFDFKKTEKENQQTYRQLAKKYHPDVAGGDEAIFKAVVTEYEYYKQYKDNAPKKGTYTKFEGHFSKFKTSEKANEAFAEFQKFAFEHKDEINEAIRSAFLNGTKRKKKMSKKTKEELGKLALKTIFNLFK